MVAHSSVQTSGPVHSPSSLSGLRGRLGTILLYVLAIALCVAFGYPFFYTLSSSLKAPSEIYIFPPTLLPEVPQWQQHKRPGLSLRLARSHDRFPIEDQICGSDCGD